VSGWTTVSSARRSTIWTTRQGRRASRGQPAVASCAAPGRAPAVCAGIDFPPPGAPGMSVPV
jgi:hypothetical protein